MSQALCFNDVQFDVIPQNSQPWIRGSQIATALQYASAQRIIELYTRHADEFTDAMTKVITLPTEGGPQETRIFSLRGCHLLAMFARTPVAKEFRRWVLDVLDKLNAERQPVGNSEQLPSPLSKRTDPERKALTAIINSWVGLAPIHYANARAQVNAHFGVTGVDKLTVAQVKEAIAWVQGKIDALPPAREQLALPSHSTVLDEQAQKVQSLMDEVKQQGNEFMSSIFTLQSALRFRLIKMNPAVPDLSKALERTLPQFVTAIGMNISALSDLLDVYSTTLAATE